MIQNSSGEGETEQYPPLKVEQLGGSKMNVTMFTEIIMKASGLILLVAAALATPPHETYLKIAPFNEITGRIVNGTPATSGQFPYQAALILTLSAGSTMCGGSLISTRYILTAAHCTSQVRSVTIALGTINYSSGGTRVAASAITNHASFNPSTLQNDISLIQVASTVSTSSMIGIVTLPDGTLGNGVSVTVSGWGSTKDDVQTPSPTLNYVELTTIDNTVCAITYGNAIQSGVVCCTGQSNKSTCTGDSGGPLVTGSGTSRVQVGIVSFGSSTGCGLGYPTAFTRVAFYRSWIKTNSGV